MKEYKFVGICGLTIGIIIFIKGIIESTFYLSWITKDITSPFICGGICMVALACLLYHSKEIKELIQKIEIKLKKEITNGI